MASRPRSPVEKELRMATIVKLAELKTENITLELRGGPQASTPQAAHWQVAPGCA